MYNTNLYTIEAIAKKHLSSEQISLADLHAIETTGRDKQGYEIVVNNTPLDPIPPDTVHGLLTARLTACNYLIEEYNYPKDGIFKSICYTNDRENDGQKTYFRVVQRLE